MISLPYSYKSVVGTTYQILRWEGQILVTKDDGGREWKLNKERTLMLLQVLGLQEQDVPGAPRKKFDGWD